MIAAGFRRKPDNGIFTVYVREYGGRDDSHRRELTCNAGEFITFNPDGASLTDSLEARERDRAIQRGVSASERALYGRGAPAAVASRNDKFPGINLTDRLIFIPACNVTLLSNRDQLTAEILPTDL